MHIKCVNIKKASKEREKIKERARQATIKERENEQIKKRIEKRKLKEREKEPREREAEQQMSIIRDTSRKNELKFISLFKVKKLKS